MTTNFEIVSGGVAPELALDIANTLGKELVPVELRRFACGERYARFECSVRRKNIVIIQSFSEVNGYSINDAILETLLIVDAARRASAGEITLVAPLLPYSRQDRKARNREPISASVVLRIFKQCGVDRVVSVDLHSAQTQAVFEGLFDHIIAQPLILEKLRSIIGVKPNDYVIVSPDTGRAKESEQYADDLGVSLVHLPKSRDHEDSKKIKRPSTVSGVKGKKCIIIDDMIDTGGTLITAADTVKESGAKSVIICATHGILSNDAAERFSKSRVSHLILTNTLPQQHAESVLGKKLHILDIAPIVAEVIRRIELGESVASMFNNRNCR